MLEHINDKKEDNDLNKDDLEENEMSKFNVGDKVIIRKDLKVGKSYNGYIFTSRMERYKGKEATVITASREKNPSTYKLDIDDKFYCWTDDMLENIDKNLNKDNLEENKMTKGFSVGDRVVIKDYLKVGSSYNGCVFVSSMKSHRGKTATVVTANYKEFTKTFVYRLDIDGGCYCWTNDMLTPADEITSIQCDKDSLSIIMDSLKIAYTNKEEEINKLKESIKTMEEKCNTLSEEMVGIVKLQATLNKQLIRKHNKETKENE